MFPLAVFQSLSYGESNQLNESNIPKRSDSWINWFIWFDSPVGDPEKALRASTMKGGE
jgi:hypothetical protein